MAAAINRAREHRRVIGFGQSGWYWSVRAAYNASVFVVIRMSTNNACPVIIDDI